MGRIAPQLSAYLDAFRPVSDERGSAASLVNPGLMTAKRSIADRRPARSEAQVGWARAGRRIGIVSIGANHDLGTRAVVGKKEDEGVIKGVHRPQLDEHAADRLVHAVDHGSMDRHLARLEIALFIGQLSPWQGAVHLPRAELLEGVGK